MCFVFFFFLFSLMKFPKHRCFLSAVRWDRLLCVGAPGECGVGTSPLAPSPGRGRRKNSSLQGGPNLLVSCASACWDSVGLLPALPAPAEAQGSGAGQRWGRVIPCAPGRAAKPRAVSRSCPRSCPASVLTSLPNSPNPKSSLFPQGSLLWFSRWEKGCPCCKQSFVYGDGRGLVLIALSSLCG